MALPASIQAQLDAATAIEAQFASAAQAADGTQAPGETQAPEVQQEAAPAAPVQAAPVPAPTPQPAPDIWEQRYRVLQGKYDAEVPRLHAQLRETNQAVQNLNAQLARQNQPQVPLEKQVTQKDVEVFGGDLIDLIGRKAQEIAGAQIASLNANIAALEARLGQTAQKQEQTDEGRFYTALAVYVPDYKEINVDQDWLRWLGEVDPLTGRNRQSYLDAAAQERNADRVASIFNAFKATRTATQATAAAAAGDVETELARQVAPSRSSTGVPKTVPSAQTKVWSSKDLTDFYGKVRRGEITSKDAARIESEINTAMVEGRVRA